MDIRLIAMDLDGTALQNDHCTFSPRLHAALEAAHARGIAIVPVTGRQFALLPPVLKKHYPWTNLAVLCNGGQIRDMHTSTVLHGLEINPGALTALLTLAKRFDLPIEFSLDGTLHLTQNDYDKQLPWPDLSFHRDTILKNHGRIVPSLAPLCGPGVEKVNLLCIPEQLKKSIGQALNSIEVSAVWAFTSSLEITHPEATKGNALVSVCRLLNVPMASVIALGDSGNDITMLRRAGLGVAMGNAPEEVKAAADVCAPPNTSDGAAIAIETYALT